jgi:hypothetical protein
MISLAREQYRALPIYGTLNIVDKSLSLGASTITTDADSNAGSIVLPGSRLKVTVQTNDASGARVMSGAAHLFVVDSNALAYSAQPPLRPQDVFNTIEWSAVSSAYNVAKTIISSRKQQDVWMNTLARRVALSPWATPQFADVVDISDMVRTCVRA